MTRETEELTADLRAMLTELKPYGRHAKKQFDETILALGVLLRRELLIRKLPPMHAEGSNYGPTAKPKKRPGRS